MSVFSDITNYIHDPVPLCTGSDFSDDCSALSEDDFIIRKRKKPTIEENLPNTENLSPGPKEIGRKKANCSKTDEERQREIKILEDRSKTDERFRKIHEVLPQTFEYIIVSLENRNEDEWSLQLRANINSKQEAQLWLEEYEAVSSCDFRIRDSKKENSPRIVWKKIFRCHLNVPQQPNLEQKSQKRKIERSSENIDCPATMRITIKNKTMKWSADDLLQKYPCEIKINHSHNHYLTSKEALRRRRPSKAVEEKFKDMFVNGRHSPSSAVTTFKLSLQAELGENYYITAADRSNCPDVKWASRLYYEIFKKFYGASDGEEMLKSLEGYINDYNVKQGTVGVAFQILHEKDVIIAVCTPLMKRTQRIRAAGEINFVDSSGTMDRHNHRVFLVLCPSTSRWFASWVHHNVIRS